MVCPAVPLAGYARLIFQLLCKTKSIKSMPIAELKSSHKAADEKTEQGEEKRQQIMQLEAA